MNILKNAFHVTPRARRMIVVLISIVILNSVQTPVAKAADTSIETSVTSTTDEPGLAYTTRERGFVVPEDYVPAKVPDVQPPAPTPKMTPRLKQKNADAPDTSAKSERSTANAIRTMTVVSTAYTSDPAETDSTPFITANGTRVRDGIIAANFLRFGTRVRIPQYYGDKVFVVTDRMNPKFNERVDIWMNGKTQAYAWGVRRVQIEILP